MNAELLTAQALKAQTAQTAQTAETARVREKARTATRRELPNSANCPTAQTARRREVPNDDNGTDIRGRELPDGAICRRAQPRNGATRCQIESRQGVYPPSAVALFGASRRWAVRVVRCWRRCRRLAPRALGQFAPLGSLRCWAVRALWQFAPFCAPARAVSASCAVRQFALFRAITRARRFRR